MTWHESHANELLTQYRLRTMTSHVIHSPFGAFSLPFPWGTPAVDALICALDARNVGTAEIVLRIKKQFPTLNDCAIPFTAVEKRILILDQNVELDYFKSGLGLARRSIESGVGSGKAIKHGKAIHAHAGEAWERFGLKTPRTRPSADSLQDPSSGRGSRLGHTIHKDHGEAWEVLDKMRGLGRERSIRKVHPGAAAKMEELLPRPLSPCRGDEHGRPIAVDHSIQKLRSFELERPSIDNQRRRQLQPPPKMHVSPFPRIPLHQRSAANLRSAQQHPAPRPTAPPQNLRPQKSDSSLKRARRILRKKSSNELNRRPLIRITKPSSERAQFATGDEETPEYLHPF